MIVSHRHRFIFFSAPKTGSESVRAALAHLNEETVQPWSYRTGARALFPHMPPAQALKLLQDRGIDVSTYRTLTSLRDPFDRMVSLYRMICAVDRIWRARRILGMPYPNFETWVRSTRPDGRGGGGHPRQKWRQYGTWSARNWCQDVSGKFIVTDLVPTPHLDQQIPRILAEIGVHLRDPLPRKNTRSATPMKDWFSADTANLIRQRYEWDIEYLAQFETETPVKLKASENMI